MNLAVLIADYLTYDFVGGVLDHFPRCDACDADSLPFVVEYVPPGDFGSVAVTYTHTGDTLFYGTIVWAGTGGLVRPDSLLPADEFRRYGGAPAPPVTRRYYHEISFLQPDDFVAKADSAWEAVAPLDIVWDFAEKSYRVGILLYTPSLGVFNPSQARWIILLYRSG